MLTNSDLYKFVSLFRNEGESITLPMIRENDSYEEIFSRKIVHPEVTDLTDFQQPKSKLVSYETTKKNNKIRFFIDHYNRNGYGIFFIPNLNIGGNKDNDVKEIRSWFVDVDYAKLKELFESENEALLRKEELEKSGTFQKLLLSSEINKKTRKEIFIINGLRTIDFITKKKKEFIEIHKKRLRKSLIVETFAGYHCYFLSRQASLENFEQIQRSLVHLFGSDFSVINLANLMRFPYFNHVKYNHPFPVKVVKWSDHRFNEFELINELKLDIQTPDKGIEKEKKGEFVSYGSTIRTSYTEKKYRGQSDLEFYSKSADSKDEMTFNEAVEELLKRPLSDFITYPEMEIGKSISCPFHRDSRPSGSVFSGFDGTELYKCHVCQEDPLSIIRLYQNHKNKGFRRSVTELSKMIGIKIIESSFEKSQFEKYRDNRRFLLEIEEFPELEKWIIGKNKKDDFLRYLLDIGETFVLKDDFSYQGHNVFFSSKRHLRRKYKAIKSDLTMQRTLVLFRLLGLIKKVPQDQIPKELKTRSEKELEIKKSEFRKQGDKGIYISKGLNEINFYIFTNWQDDFSKIHQRARLLTARGFLLSKHTEKSSLIELFGEELAEEVYPDSRKIPHYLQTIADAFTSELEKEIKEKGFAIKENIIKKRIRIKDYQKSNYRKQKDREKVFKTFIESNPSYEIQRVRSESKKQQLGIFKMTGTVTLIKPKNN